MKNRRVVFYEVPEGFQREEGVEYVDGMEDLIGDDVLDTDYDIEIEDPPHLAFITEGTCPGSAP